MISFTTNTRGCTKMSANLSFATMDGPTLVRAFNEMANSDTGKELSARTVVRFADTKTGIKRCEMLASSIRARKEGLSAPEPRAAAKKPSPKAKAPAKEKTLGANTSANKLAAEFEARAGTNREKLLVALDASYRKLVPLNTLLKAVYGSQNTENKGALMMSIKGALLTIKNNKLPYQIKKEKNAEKEISFGLYPSA